MLGVGEAVTQPESSGNLAMYDALASAALRRCKNNARLLHRTIADFERVSGMDPEGKRLVLEKLRAAYSQLDLPVEHGR